MNTSHHAPRLRQHRFLPTVTQPVELGPLPRTVKPRENRDIDRYLGDLYGPGAPPQSLIVPEQVPTQSKRELFPPVMWAWATGTAILAILAVLLIL